jgi:hypothetical protein
MQTLLADGAHLPDPSHDTLVPVEQAVAYMSKLGWPLGLGVEPEQPASTAIVGSPLAELYANGAQVETGTVDVGPPAHVSEPPYATRFAEGGQPPVGPLHEQAPHVGSATLVPPETAPTGQSGSLQGGFGLDDVESTIGPDHPVGTCTHVPVHAPASAPASATASAPASASGLPPDSASPVPSTGPPPSGASCATSPVATSLAGAAESSAGVPTSIAVASEPPPSWEGGGTRSPIP